LIGLVLASGQAAASERLELAALSNLTPKLELKSQLLERRFELVLLRHQTTVEKAAAQCKAGERGACRLQDWQDFLAEIADSAESDQLYRVNRYMNHYRYTEAISGIGGDPISGRSQRSSSSVAATAKTMSSPSTSL
jgi:hypothetical protein